MNKFQIKQEIWVFYDTVGSKKQHDLIFSNVLAGMRRLPLLTNIHEFKHLSIRVHALLKVESHIACEPFNKW